jgi:DNA modification methylase
MNQYLTKIIQGDSLEILRQLPSNLVDAVITDPSYSSGGMILSQKNQDPVKKYERTSNKIVYRATFFGDNKDS